MVKMRRKSKLTSTMRSIGWKHPNNEQSTQWTIYNNVILTNNNVECLWFHNDVAKLMDRYCPLKLRTQVEVCMILYDVMYAYAAVIINVIIYHCYTGFHLRPLTVWRLKNSSRLRYCCFWCWGSWHSALKMHITCHLAVYEWVLALIYTQQKQVDHTKSIIMWVASVALVH